MPTDPHRVKLLFQAAVEHARPEDRAAYLDRECVGEPELRARVEKLLAAHEHPATVLRTPAGGDGGGGGTTLDVGATATVRYTDPAETQPEDRQPTAKPASPPPPAALLAGRYKIREAIGEGGMGSVYLADQVQPIKRKVALKLIRPGMDTQTVLARFEAERQALAVMDHPHIAKVLDAGTTKQGRPFFVMGLVKGIPLTDYCDQHRLGVTERLKLFCKICQAVQHAHQKGIIHRDLKPGNILVEDQDGKPVPKVIDFGLAKAIAGVQLAEHTIHSAFGSVAGTPLYMAPEQAMFNALDIDTRADIYALGVILYELLTGSTPIQRESIRRAAVDELLRVIREVEPPKPSSRISTSEALPSLAANRHAEPARLSRLVKGDLDWIVMKALAKERARRYDSAIGLGNDVERFLNHEPVAAGPPTAGYRVRKFVRRHRGQVVAASLVMLALVGGIVGTTLGLFEANHQRKTAVARMKQVEAMNGVLGSVFHDLDPARAEKEGKPLAVLLGERLNRAAEILDESAGDPIPVARMQRTLGESMLGLGHPARALVVLERAKKTLAAQLGPDHPETLSCLFRIADATREIGQRERAVILGWSVMEQGRRSEAEPLLRAGYELMKPQRNSIFPRWRNRMPDDVGRLARLCEAMKRPAEAKRWREEQRQLQPERLTKAGNP